MTRIERQVLRAVFNQNGSAYGVTIRREILDCTGRDISIGSIYVILERLESKGHVSSRVGEAMPLRGDRAKRYFKIKARGCQALRGYAEELS